MTAHQNNLNPVHRLASVGYDVVVGSAFTAADAAWYVWEEGMGTSDDVVGKADTQAGALAMAANIVLRDVEAETGTPEGRVVHHPHHSLTFMVAHVAAAITTDQLGDRETFEALHDDVDANVYLDDAIAAAAKVESHVPTTGPAFIALANRLAAEVDDILPLVR